MNSLCARTVAIAQPDTRRGACSLNPCSVEALKSELPNFRQNDRFITRRDNDSLS